MTEKIIPDGYKLVAVKGLDELVYWLERCKDKGHLENCADLIEPFEAFEYRNISEESAIAAHEQAAPAVPQGEPFGYFRAEPFGWTDCAADDEGAIALYERPAAPAVPDTDELESALERLVERCNTDQFLSNDDAVIHAEATLERIYKTRKSTATPAAPSQEPAVPQGVIYEKADSLYKRGYTDRQNGKDYDPRGCDEWQEVVDWLTPAAQSQPVTLTDEDIDNLARKHAGDPSCSGAWGSTYEFEPSELRAFVNEIAALREKEGE